MRSRSSVVASGAYWNIDYYKDLHLFTTETDALHPDPTPLTPTHPTLMQLTTQQDLSQVATRVFVEGGGGTVLVDLQPGETMVPMDTVGWYPPSGTVAAGPQRLTYTSLAPTDGVGSLVGPGVTPSTAPGVTPTAGTGVDAGTHTWAYTWVTPSGETLPSPVTAASTQAVVAPTTAAVAAGPYLTGVAAPPTAPTANPATPSGAGYIEPGSYDYVVTFVTAAGETTVGPLSNAVNTSAANGIIPLTNVPVGPAGVTNRRIYRRKNGTGTFNLVTTTPDNVNTQYGDGTGNGFLGGVPPATQYDGGRVLGPGHVRLCGHVRDGGGRDDAQPDQ